MDWFISTPTYTYDTTNTHGRQRGCDCVVRAISLAMNKTWLEVFDDLVALARKKGRMPNDDNVYKQYLYEQGWTMCSQPRRKDNTKYTGKEFVTEIAEGRVCIMSMAKHLTCCLADGKIHDTWNCEGKTIGNYWVKE